MTTMTKAKNKLGEIHESRFDIADLVAAGQASIVRIGILLVMGEDLNKEWSPSDMQRELVLRGMIVKGAPPSLGSISYHFRVLSASRWIRRSSTGRVRGALENFYRVDGRRV